jgi:hypothetical protein
VGRACGPGIFKNVERTLSPENVWAGNFFGIFFTVKRNFAVGSPGHTKFQSGWWPEAHFVTPLVRENIFG